MYTLFHLELDRCHPEFACRVFPNKVAKTAQEEEEEESEYSDSDSESQADDSDSDDFCSLAILAWDI